MSEKPNLQELLGYSDRISEVYEDFLLDYETKGLQWAWMIRKEFFMIPADKKILPMLISLPLLTYTRINIMLSKAEVEKQIEELKKKYATLPEFQGRELPTLPTIRDYLDQFFSVYGDDEIEFKISYYHHTLVHVTGKVNEIKFNIDDVVNNPKVRVVASDMVSVTIKLLNKGEQRLEEEYKAFIGEANEFVKEKLNPEVVKNKFKDLPSEILNQRKELFKIDPATPEDQVVWDVEKLNISEIVALEETVNAAANPELTNDQVKAQVNCMRLINLVKMVDWLTRPYAGGTEQDYR